MLIPSTLAAFLSLAAQEPVIPNLFEAVPPNEITRLHDTEGAVRQKNVTIDYDLLFGGELQSESGDEILINLFDDVALIGTKTSTELVYANGRIVNYAIGDNGWDYAQFSVVGKAVTGVIQVGHSLYTVRNVGSGELTVSEVDSSLLPQCGVDDRMNDCHSVKEKPGSGERGHNAHVSHIMLVYTDDVTAAEGGEDGALSVMNAQVATMNRALANGDSEFRVNLVHAYEQVYAETGDMNLDLNRLTNTGDGFFEDVPGLRDDYGADFVALFTEGPSNYGGLAWVNCTLTSSWNSAFSVNDTGIWYVLAHEIGHNMGLKHNHTGSGSSSSCTNYYAFGYRSTNYRTIMAYSPGSKLAIYSNPSMIDPDGEVLGDFSDEDSARHIYENYDSYVGFRGGVTIFHQIETLLDGGNGGGGNMFDIKPKEDISLTGIAINSSITVGATAMVDVYYREGSWAGHDNSSSGWTLLESLSAPSEGSGVATKMDFDIYVGQDKVFEAGKTYGIFIAATNGINGNFRYTNGEATYEDSYVRLESGCGKTYGGFGGTTYNDRIWNGILYYDGAWGEHYLSTTLASDISTFTGNMFEVDVHEDVVISSFDVNVSTPVGDIAGVDVWYKSGSYAGHENTPESWTWLGNDNKAVSSGPDAYTTIAVSSPTLYAGSTYSFYIRVGNGDTINYTSGSSSWGNSDMTINCGVGLGGANPFGTDITDRTWNGRLRYRSADDAPHMTIDDLVGGGSGEITFSNCSPGGTVYSAYSLKGGGPTSTAWGTVYMTRPWVDLAPLTADPNGEAKVPVSVPISLTGRTIWMQGLDWESSTLTNGVETTVL